MILATFSFSWFTTIPGMLITGGVLLLIIALVIFIVTSNKKPKNNKTNVSAPQSSVDNTIVATTPSVDTNVTTADVAPQVVPTTATPSVKPEEEIKNDNVVGATIANNVPVEKEPAVFTNPIPMEVAATPTVGVNEPLRVEPVPTQTEPLSMPQEEVTQVVEQPATVVSQEPPVTVVEAPKAEPLQMQNVEAEKQEERPIYGGANPVIPNIQVEEEHRPIYGGANPLDSTQSIPTIKEDSPAVEKAGNPVVEEKELTVEVPKIEPAEVKKEEVQVESLF